MRRPFFRWCAHTETAYHIYLYQALDKASKLEFAAVARGLCQFMSSTSPLLSVHVLMSDT